MNIILRVLMGLITDLILLPFRIVEAVFKLIAATIEAMIQLVVGLVDFTFTLVDGLFKICLFIMLLPFKILGALLPPYGSGGGSNSNSRKGRAK